MRSGVATSGEPVPEASDGCVVGNQVDGTGPVANAHGPASPGPHLRPSLRLVRARRERCQRCVVELDLPTCRSVRLVVADVEALALTELVGDLERLVKCAA